MADPRGFEPRIAESKSAELPLLHGPICTRFTSPSYIAFAAKPHIAQVRQW